jgi:hypothetical protein
VVFEIHPDGSFCSQWTGTSSEAVLTAFGAASIEVPFPVISV